MTKRQTRQYEMLVRVRTFGVNHQKQFADGSEVTKAFATVVEFSGRTSLMKPEAERYGDREPRYAEIAMMSSSERFATARFINAAALPALDP